MSGPAGKWRDGGLEIAAWQNERGVSFTINKRYKPKGSEEWKDSKYFFASDLEKLLGLLPSALVFAKQNEPEQGEVKELVGEAKEAPQGRVFDDDDIPF